MNQLKTLKLANATMAATAACFVLTLFLAYGLEDSLPLLLLTFLHVFQILLSGLFKVSYVIRLVTQKQLGMEVC